MRLASHKLQESQQALRELEVQITDYKTMKTSYDSLVGQKDSWKHKAKDYDAVAKRCDDLEKQWENAQSQLRDAQSSHVAAAKEWLSEKTSLEKDLRSATKNETTLEDLNRSLKLHQDTLAAGLAELTISASSPGGTIEAIKAERDQAVQDKNRADQEKEAAVQEKNEAVREKEEAIALIDDLKSQLETRDRKVMHMENEIATLHKEKTGKHVGGALESPKASKGPKHHKEQTGIIPGPVSSAGPSKSGNQQLHRPGYGVPSYTPVVPGASKPITKASIYWVVNGAIQLAAPIGANRHDLEIAANTSREAGYQKNKKSYHVWNAVVEAKKYPLCITSKAAGKNVYYFSTIQTGPMPGACFQCVTSQVICLVRLTNDSPRVFAQELPQKVLDLNHANDRYRITAKADATAIKAKPSGHGYPGPAPKMPPQLPGVNKLAGGDDDESDEGSGAPVEDEEAVEEQMDVGT